MSDNTEEIRYKTTKEKHALFHGIARARGIDAADLSRDILDRFLEEEARVAKLVASYLPSEGIGGNGNGRRSSRFCMPGSEPADEG